MTTYTVGQFAKIVGVHRTTLQRWDREGVLPAGRTISNRRFYTNEHLEKVRPGMAPPDEVPPFRPKKESVTDEEPPTLQTCSQCGGTPQPIANFNRCKRRRCGYAAHCKACQRRYERAYTGMRRAQVNANHRRWWATATERVAALKERRRPAVRAYQMRTQAVQKAANRLYHFTHRAEVRERKRRWRAENRDLARAYQRRRKARKRAAGALYGHHTEAEWQQRLAASGGCCVFCGSNGRITRDHIVPLSRGGTDRIDNIQPLCFSCNAWKKDRLLSGPYDSSGPAPALQRIGGLAAQ